MMGGGGDDIETYIATINMDQMGSYGTHMPSCSVTFSIESVDVVAIFFVVLSALLLSTVAGSALTNLLNSASSRLPRVVGATLPM